jgi:hypothetical protein
MRFATDRRTLLKACSVSQNIFSNEGVEAVAKFYASRKNDTPSYNVAELILVLVNIAVIVPNKWVSLSK